MGLKVAGIDDLLAWSTDAGHGGGSHVVSEGGAGTNPPQSPLAYYDRLDRLYAKFRATNPTGGGAWTGYADPLFFTAASPLSNAKLTGTVWDSLFVGSWDKVQNAQRLYGRTDTGNAFVELDPATLQQVAADPYPNVGANGTRNGKSSTTDGWYGNSDGNLVFFEGLGKAFIPVADVRSGGTTYANVPVEVDLATGDGVPIADLPTSYNTSPNQFQEGQVFGDTANLRQAQFVADDESTFAAPKGFLLLTDVTRKVTNGILRLYVRIVDWNPLGVQGTPTRVHKRERLLSRLEVSEGDAPPVGLGGAGLYNSQRVWFHPPSDSLRMLFYNASFGDLQTGEMLLLRLAPTAALADVTSPTAEEVVQTGKRVRHAVTAHGSLGEPIAGVDVAWTLRRASTRLEVLDTQGAPATSTVANPPVDPGTLEVFDDGGAAPLVEGVDYSVDLATGVITWLATTPDDGDGRASYRHSEAPADPPHGTLLVAASTTDEHGKAITEVRYPDDSDLVGQFDRLEADAVQG